MTRIALAAAALLASVSAGYAQKPPYDAVVRTAATTYTVTAQAYSGGQRIHKTVRAMSEAAVLQLVSPELAAAGYYPISIIPNGRG